MLGKPLNPLILSLFAELVPQKLVKNFQLLKHLKPFELFCSPNDVNHKFANSNKKSFTLTLADVIEKAENAM